MGMWLSSPLPASPARGEVPHRACRAHRPFPLPLRERVDRAKRETGEGFATASSYRLARHPSSALRAPSPARGEGKAGRGVRGSSVREERS